MAVKLTVNGQVHAVDAESGTPPAALVNAIFAATGKRIRTQPIGEQLP